MSERFLVKSRIQMLNVADDVVEISKIFGSMGANTTILALQVATIVKVTVVVVSIR